MLDVAPDTESQIRAYAEAEGISIDELLKRTFSARTLRQAKPTRTTRKPRAGAAARSTRSTPRSALSRQGQAPTTETPEETKVRVQALLLQRQAETGGLPEFEGGYKSIQELFTEWAKEDAKMTPEERQAEREFWEDYERERPNRPFQI